MQASLARARRYVNVTSGPFTRNPYVHFIKVPTVARARTAAPQPSRNRRAKLQHPAADRFIGYFKPALGQQILDVAVAQDEAQIKPYRVLDDRGREAMAAGPYRDANLSAAHPNLFP